MYLARAFFSYLSFVVLTCSGTASAWSGKIEMVATFSDYKREEIKIFYTGEDGEDYVQTYDVVTMRISDISEFEGFDFFIKLTEKPARNEFTKTGEQTILIEESALEEYINENSDGFINSSEIDFK
ncbi:hypothetical protein JXL83_00850 [candidate division WOR-3 bacterium]|nr:hypothetical protein [candidate division WOR-3 bacterium]